MSKVSTLCLEKSSLYNLVSAKLNIAVNFAVSLSEKLGKLMRCCQIQHSFNCIEYLCKLREDYLTLLTSKFYIFF